MMKKALLASAMVLALPIGIAKADLILTNTAGNPATSITDSFVDIGAEGFGAAPRILTLQTHPIETGAGVPVNQVTGDAVPGANKTTTPTLGALGWTNGSQVGIGFNTDQTGGSTTGLTMQSLTLKVYASNGTTVLGTFNLSPSETPLTFTAADLALQQGNGNAVFDFGLTAAERVTFNAITALPGSAADFIGLGSSLGCGSTAPPGCLPANDGPDSFLAFTQPSAVPGPIAGAGLPGLIGMAIGLVALGRRRITRWRFR